MFIFLFFSCFYLQANILYEEILSNFPKSQKMLYSGSKYLVGTMELDISVTKENNILKMHNHEKVFIMAITAHQSFIDSELKLASDKPTYTRYKDFRK